MSKWGSFRTTACRSKLCELEASTYPGRLILLCWLALLLTIIARNESGENGHQLKKVLLPLLEAEHATQHGIISQTYKLTTEQKRVLNGLNLKTPKRRVYLPTPNRA